MRHGVVIAADAEANCTYVLLGHDNAGETSRTIELPPEVTVNVDVDPQGRVVGFEFVGWTPASVPPEARRIRYPDVATPRESARLIGDGVDLPHAQRKLYYEELEEEL